MREQKLEDALIAIRALINGEYDKPELMRFGALHVDTNIEILSIIERTLK